MQCVSYSLSNPITGTTWVFSGGKVNQIQWGTKKDGIFIIEDVLVTLDRLVAIPTITNSP